jgi:hypothetical protein
MSRKAHNQLKFFRKSLLWLKKIPNKSQISLFQPMSLKKKDEINESIGVNGANFRLIFIRELKPTT